MGSEDLIDRIRRGVIGEGEVMEGPYGYRLLGIDEEQSAAIARQVELGVESAKPGWARVNFNYFLSEAVFSFLLDAIEFVADRGTCFLPDYRLDPASGRWRHRESPHGPPRSLLDVRYEDGELRIPWIRRTEPEAVLPGYLGHAHRLADARTLLTVGNP